MPEFDFERTEAFNTALRLATSVGRLRIASNLKATADAHTAAFSAAGRACALIAEGAGREGGAQVAAYRDARAALAQCAAWLQVLASLTNEPPSLFAEELGDAELCSRQLAASIRAADRSTGPPPPRPGPGPGPGPGPRGPQHGRGGPGPRPGGGR